VAALIETSNDRSNESLTRLAEATNRTIPTA
jgi:hypothetical protein